MSTKSNGEPFVDTINFGSHYCAMWRMDDTDTWTILSDGKGCRRIFPSAYTAITETIRLKKRPVHASAAAAGEDSAITAWRAEKMKEDEELRRRVFGSARPKIVFSNGRAVTVETKTRTRA